MASSSERVFAVLFDTKLSEAKLLSKRRRFTTLNERFQKIKACGVTHLDSPETATKATQTSSTQVISASSQTLSTDLYRYALGLKNEPKPSKALNISNTQSTAESDEQLTIDHGNTVLTPAKLKLSSPPAGSKLGIHSSNLTKDTPSCHSPQVTKNKKFLTVRNVESQHKNQARALPPSSDIVEPPKLLVDLTHLPDQIGAAECIELINNASPNNRQSSINSHVSSTQRNGTVNSSVFSSESLLKPQSNNPFSPNKSYVGAGAKSNSNSSKTLPLSDENKDNNEHHSKHQNAPLNSTAMSPPNPFALPKRKQTNSVRSSAIREIKLKDSVVESPADSTIHTIANPLESNGATNTPDVDHSLRSIDNSTPQMLEPNDDLNGKTAEQDKTCQPEVNLPPNCGPNQPLHRDPDDAKVATNLELTKTTAKGYESMTAVVTKSDNLDSCLGLSSSEPVLASDPDPTTDQKIQSTLQKNSPAAVPNSTKILQPYSKITARTNKPQNRLDKRSNSRPQTGKPETKSNSSITTTQLSGNSSQPISSKKLDDSANSTTCSEQSQVKSVVDIPSRASRSLESGTALECNDGKKSCMESTLRSKAPESTKPTSINKGPSEKDGHGSHSERSTSPLDAVKSSELVSLKTVIGKCSTNIRQPADVIENSFKSNECKLNVKEHDEAAKVTASGNSLQTSLVEKADPFKCSSSKIAQPENLPKAEKIIARPLKKEVSSPKTNTSPHGVKDNQARPKNAELVKKEGKSDAKSESQSNKSARSSICSSSISFKHSREDQELNGKKNKPSDSGPRTKRQKTEHRFRGAEDMARPTPLLLLDISENKPSPSVLKSDFPVNSKTRMLRSGKIVTEPFQIGIGPLTVQERVILAIRDRKWNCYSDIFHLSKEDLNLFHDLVLDRLRDFKLLIAGRNYMGHQLYPLTVEDSLRLFNPRTRLGVRTLISCADGPAPPTLSDLYDALEIFPNVMKRYLYAIFDIPLPGKR